MPPRLQNMELFQSSGLEFWWKLLFQMSWKKREFVRITANMLDVMLGIHKACWIQHGIPDGKCITWTTAGKTDVEFAGITVKMWVFVKPGRVTWFVAFSWGYREFVFRKWSVWTVWNVLHLYLQKLLGCFCSMFWVIVRLHCRVFATSG